MGTLCEVQVYHDDPVAARDAATAALDAMERAGALLSNYKPQSQLSAMNREAARAPFHASAELFDFVNQCANYHHATGGAFDPAVGPLVRAWGFMTSHPAVPSEAAIADAKARSGFDKVTLNTAARTVAYSTEALTNAAFVLPRETVRRLFEGERDVHALRVECDCGDENTMWVTPWSSGVFVPE